MVAGASIGSVEEWAKKEGITRQAAYKRIREHNIPLTNGKLNFDLADKIWQATMNPIKQRGGVAAAAAAAGQTDLFSDTAPGPDSPALAAMSPTLKRSMGDVQYARESTRARREFHMLQRELGEVIPVAQVSQFYGEMFGLFSDQLDAIGSELMDDLARETDPLICREMVDARINKAKQTLAEWKPTKQ